MSFNPDGFDPGSFDPGSFSMEQAGVFSFSFDDITGVARSTPQTSNLITVENLTGSVAVSITGGTYTKNGGAPTSAPGTAVNGDTFLVHHTSSAAYLTAVNTALTIGSASDTFTSTTMAEPAQASGDTDVAVKMRALMGVRSSFRSFA